MSEKVKLSRLITILNGLFVEYGDIDIITSSDEEGNSYSPVIEELGPSAGYYDGESFYPMPMSKKDKAYYKNEGINIPDRPNAICLN